MTFVDDKTFWAQLGKITYRRIDNTPTIDTTEINAADDFDSLFCTDKQVQRDMLDLFHNAIDITNKYIVLPDSNAAVGISSDMSVQEIESFKNNSANCFVGTGYYEKLLRRLLLENTHTAEILLRPSQTCGQERQEREL